MLLARAAVIVRGPLSIMYLDLQSVMCPTVQLHHCHMSSLYSSSSVAYHRSSCTCVYGNGTSPIDQKMGSGVCVGHENFIMYFVNLL